MAVATRAQETDTDQARHGHFRHEGQEAAVTIKHSDIKVPSKSHLLEITFAPKSYVFSVLDDF